MSGFNIGHQYIGRVKRTDFEHAQCADAHYHAHAQSHSLHLTSLKYPMTVCGQQMSYSDCTDAQADLDLSCPHMPKGTVSHGTAHILVHLYQYS